MLKTKAEDIGDFGQQERAHIPEGYVGKLLYDQSLYTHPHVAVPQWLSLLEDRARAGVIQQKHPHKACTQPT